MKSNLVSFLALSGMLVGCGGGTSNNNNDDAGTTDKHTVVGTESSKYATSKVTLPQTSSQLAWDLDGDGTPDDRLGTIIGILNQAQPVQPTVDTAVKAGTLLVLLDETSTDSTQQKASSAGVTFQLATAPATPPKYDGTDTFTGTGAISTFYGNIAGGVFTSLDPAKDTVSTNITVGLPLVDGAPPIQLPVSGGRITFTADSSGNVTGGQINGALKKTDLDTIVLPAVANLLTAKLMAEPNNTTFKMFDTNDDGTVTVTEIQNNSLLKQFLAPDIQMFAHPSGDLTTYGAYQPTPNGTVKDCLSVGFGFQAVKASF